MSHRSAHASLEYIRRRPNIVVPSGDCDLGITLEQLNARKRLKRLNVRICPSYERDSARRD
jgi:hypothetical protein